MTLPLSGNPISMSQVNQELGLVSPYNQTISLNDSLVRNLFGLPTADTTISMSNGYGKSNRPQISYIITGSTAEPVINVSSLSGYVAGSSDIVITINGSVYVYANYSTGTGLYIGGASAGDTVRLNNYGYILGGGGNGGNGAGLTANAPDNGVGGGVALNLGCNINIFNSGTIGGGGGGGGGGAASWVIGGGDDSGPIWYYAGGGGGGGRTGLNPSLGGVGPGQSSAYTGANGNHINPGSGAQYGGGGGQWGASGINGSFNPTNGAYRNNPNGGLAGAAGKCINLNGYAVTWLEIGTRLGAIS